MAFLSSRFGFNSTRGQFHSSGLTTGNGVTAGATSSQSFEQRKQIEHNRRTITSYRDATIINAYRKDAYASDKSKSEEDKRKKRHTHRTSRVDIDEQPSSRVCYVQSSRIDVVKTSRRAFNAGQSPAPQTADHAPRYQIERPSFREPQSRGYDKYQ